MINLMQLEYKKFNFKYNIMAIVASNITVLGILYLVIINQIDNQSVAITNLSQVLGIISPLMDIIFIILTAFLVSKVIISEYTNNTISLMFSYPINRKKIMLAKLFVVLLTSFFLSLISYIVIILSYLFIAQLHGNLMDTIAISSVSFIIGKIIISSITSPLIGLISLYFGQLKNLRSSTILSSTVLALFLNIIQEHFSTSMIRFTPLLLCFMGVLVAIYTIIYVEEIDL